MSVETATPAAPRPLVPLLWRVLGLCLFLITAAHDATYLTQAMPGGPYATTGLQLSPTLDAQGFFALDGVAPDTPAARADVRLSDWVRFDQALQSVRLYGLENGETVGLTVRRGEQQIPVTLVTEGGMRSFNLRALVQGGVSIFILLVGVFITLRSLRSRSGYLLGVSLGGLALTGTYLALWENHPLLALPMLCLLSTVFTSTALLIFAFALVQRAETSGSPARPIWSWTFRIYCAGAILLSVYAFGTYAAARSLPVLGDLFLVTGLWTQVGFFLALFVLVQGWRESVGEVRTRYGFLILALALLLIGIQGIGLLINLTGNNWDLDNPPVIAGLVLTAAGVLAFAYAVLRHRVIDLGFAVNRTLVYGVLSTVLLVAFGLAEWGVEKILPVETHEASVLVSGGIAMAIFLVFHHARDLVEKVVEHVFFNRWRQNEERLRRFLRDAAYVTRPEALRRATIEEFRRFSGGAEVALYEIDSTGVRRLDGGPDQLPTEVDPDNSALVRMRADREPLAGDEARALQAELVAPMVQRSELIGFVAFGPKPTGDAWRPDETALLAEAAEKIGLDLHALQVEQLRQQVGALDAQLKLALGLARAPALA